jgi:hypothetical protein
VLLNRFGLPYRKATNPFEGSNFKENDLYDKTCHWRNQHKLHDIQVNMEGSIVKVMQTRRIKHERRQLRYLLPAIYGVAERERWVASTWLEMSMPKYMGGSLDVLPDGRPLLPCFYP